MWSFSMSVTLTQLRTFLAVVRTGSVRAAADELFVTQPVSYTHLTLPTILRV